jgi:murein L,D-transpeptidase YcbB/YkuD
MMLKVFITLLSVVISAVFTGCATTSTSQIQENQQLKARIVQLESEIQKREDQKKQLEAQMEEERRSKEDFEKRVKLGYVSKNDKDFRNFDSPNAIKKIQVALKNAGYDVGLIDGKMGTKTKNSVKKFQKENNLTADGVVGFKTWAKLSSYLK